MNELDKFIEKVQEIKQNTIREKIFIEKLQKNEERFKILSIFFLDIMGKSRFCIK